jgi:hypothetical protein
MLINLLMLKYDRGTAGPVLLTGSVTCHQFYCLTVTIFVYLQYFGKKNYFLMKLRHTGNRNQSGFAGSIHCRRYL